MSTFSSQRIVLMSRLLVGSSSSSTSGLENSACASSTRSFQPGAISRMSRLCWSTAISRPSRSSPARASAV
ncbi:Uncharacterised protein [Bordetella pertussis]|nr:Uncharacterised protein [Bordetella pertussis]